MEKIIISTNKNNVTKSEIVKLFQECGWGRKHGILSTQEIFSEDSFVVFAKTSKGQLIGLLRVLREGKYSMNIIDMVSHPSYQKRNIGNRMIKEVQKFYNKPKIYVEEMTESNNYFFVNRGFKLRNNIQMPWISKIFNY